MDLRGFAVVSSDGSFFDASKALLVDTSSLSEDEIDLLNEGTDSERWELACARGLSLCSVVSLDQ